MTGPAGSRLAGRAVRGVRRGIEAASRLALTQLALAAYRTGVFLARSLSSGRVVGAHTVEGVEEPRLGLALTAQVAMDEVVLALMNNPSRVPGPRELARVGREVEAAHHLYAEHGWLDEPAAYHTDPPPLEHPDVRGVGRRGARCEQLAFESCYEPHPDEPGRARWLAHEANRTAGAWLLRHRDRPRPWLVCLHGFGTGRAALDLYWFRATHLHRALGLNLVVPIHPMHGPRSSPRSSPTDFMSHDLMNVVHGMAQSVWDARRVLSWVRRTQDPVAIGVYGVSLGGYVGSLLVGLEDRLDCVIAGVPICDLPGLFAHHASSRLVRRPDSDALLGERATEVLSVVSPLRFEPRVERARRFVFAGLLDRLATPRQAHELWEHWGRPPIAWYGGNHVGYRWSDEVDDFVRDALVGSGLAVPDERPSDGG